MTQEMPVFIIELDAPLIIEYDPGTGKVGVSAPAGLSDGSQGTFGFLLTPEAAVQLQSALRKIETTQEKPPSAHTKPRTRQ